MLKFELVQTNKNSTIDLLRPKNIRLLRCTILIKKLVTHMLKRKAKKELLGFNNPNRGLKILADRIFE